MSRENKALCKTVDETFAQYIKMIRALLVWNYWPNNNISWFYCSVPLAHPVETSFTLIKREPPTYFMRREINVHFKVKLNYGTDNLTALTTLTIWLLQNQTYVFFLAGPRVPVPSLFSLRENNFSHLLLNSTTIVKKQTTTLLTTLLRLPVTHNRLVFNL